MLYLDIIKIIIKVMKKLVMFGLVALALQSCSIKQKYAEYKFNKLYEETYKNRTPDSLVFHDCEQSRVNSYNYEDTITRVFLGVDSIFQGKNIRDVEDSLKFLVVSEFQTTTKHDIKDIRNGYTFRVWYDYKKYDLDTIYSPEFYQIVR
jgi:hypothetical protein